MQALHLTYYQRVILWNHLGSIQVEKLREASIYLRLIEKLRLTDQEITETQFVMEGPRFSWRLPEADYGSRTVEFEDEEMQALAGALEKVQGVRVNDAQWMLKLVESAAAGGEAR
jgi:hypothetical protein